jgi:tyrosine-protein kinase Etk/Wzc
MAEINKKSSNNSFDSDDLIPVIKFIGKNWILVPIMCSIAFVIAYFESHQQPDIYGATAEILLKSNNSISLRESGISNLNQVSLLRDINNQKQTIKSKDFIGKIVEKLNFNLNYFIVGRIRTSQVSNFGSIKVYCPWEKISPKLYGIPIFIKVIDRDKIQISYNNRLFKIFQEIKFGQLYKDGNIEIKLELSDNISEEEFKLILDQTYKLIVNSDDQLIDKFSQSIEINNNENTSILEFSISDGLPEVCEQFLDTLTKEYINYTIKSELDINYNTIKFIDKQLKNLNAENDSLSLFLENNVGGDVQNNELTQEQNEAIDNLKKLDVKFAEISNKINSLQNLSKSLENINIENRFKIYLFDIEDDYLIKEINKIPELIQRRNNLLFDLKPSDSRVKRIENETLNHIQNMIDYINFQVKIYEKKLQELNKLKENSTPKIQSLNHNLQEKINIERKLTINESIINFLLEKRANTLVARASIIPESTIIQKSRSLGIIGPDRKKFTLLSIALGFIMAILIGFVRMLFFERIENSKELKSISKIPTIGGVPFYAEADDNPISIVSAPRSNISESFRSIRTNLQYLLPKDDKKIMLVSSLHPGEGKTFVSVNLASTFAKAGKRVILLDFDMHKPKIHKVFKRQNLSGLSSYLVNQKDWRESVIHSEIQNLDIILAGPVPPNASELVLSSKVDDLIADLKENYDFIIIDTPPLALISDSLVLMNKVQLGVFVMNTQKATKQGVRFLEDTLEQNEISHVTLLLNNIKQNKWRYYYSKYAYKYGYGYVYGYGYGYGDGYRYGYGEYSENAEKARKKSND